MAYIVPKNLGGIGTDSLSVCVEELDNIYTITVPIENDFIDNLPIINTIQQSNWIDSASVIILNGIIGLEIKVQNVDAFGEDVKLLTNSKIIRTDIYRTDSTGTSKTPARVSYNNMGNTVGVTDTSYFLPIYGKSENELKSMIADALSEGDKIMAEYIVGRTYS